MTQGMTHKGHKFMINYLPKQWGSVHIMCRKIEVNYPFCRLQLVVETFRHLMIKQPIKIHRSPHRC